LWEIVVKVRVGKLEADIRDIVAAVNAQGFETLEIRPEHLEGLTLLLEDQHVSAYSVAHVTCTDKGP
jgi:PIN domain nuclease of toxin-antitoxin system